MIDLNKEIPGFSDPATRKQIIQQIDQFALTLGFSQKEIQSIKDPRMILMAYKAMGTGKKDGGAITGPGGSRDDAIPIHVSNGEYVVKASVVKALGKEFFDRLNNSVK